MTSFNSILHWRQIKHWYIVVFEIVNWNWGGIILKVPIRLKFKLYAVFIEWGSRISFWFVGKQNVVNYCGFPSKVSRNRHKHFAPKNAGHDYLERFKRMSHRDRLVCFADFVGLICLHSFFCYHYQLTSRSFWSTLLQLSWNFFTTNNICNFWHSKFQQAEPTRFAAGTIFLRKNGIAILPITFESARNPHPRCWLLHL